MYSSPDFMFKTLCNQLVTHWKFWLWGKSRQEGTVLEPWAYQSRAAVCGSPDGGLFFNCKTTGRETPLKSKEENRKEIGKSKSQDSPN